MDQELKKEASWFTFDTGCTLEEIMEPFNKGSEKTRCADPALHGARDRHPAQNSIPQNGVLTKTFSRF